MIREAKQHNELYPIHIKGTEKYIADVFTRMHFLSVMSRIECILNCISIFNCVISTCLLKNFNTKDKMNLSQFFVVLDIFFFGSKNSKKNSL